MRLDLCQSARRRGHKSYFGRRNTHFGIERMRLFGLFAAAQVSAEIIVPDIIRGTIVNFTIPEDFKNVLRCFEKVSLYSKHARGLRNAGQK
jgi:hypothetical protein